MKKKTIFIIIGIVILLAGLGVAHHFLTKIPENPENATGNTAGNLISGGLFCELDGKIYFSNPYDSGRLYSMNPDCSNVKKISDDSVSFINGCGRYLYYVKYNGASMDWVNAVLSDNTYSIMRCRVNGSQSDAITSGRSATDLALSGNTLIYNTKNSLTHSIGTDGNDSKLIAEENNVNAGIYQGYVYYSSKTNRNRIYTMSVETGASAIYLDVNAYLPTRVDNTLYYIDLDNDYALTKLDISTNTKSVITTDKVVLYNVYDNVIFCQTENDVHELVRISTDGNNRAVIFQGDVTSISCTSEYTFFQKFGSDSMYRVPTKGLPAAEAFIP